LDDDLYPYDFDIVWVCADLRGSLAAFVTAGRGPVPEIILSEWGEGIGEIESVILNMVKSLEASIIGSYLDETSFRDLSERGLYVYDWSDIHRSISQYSKKYEKVALPQKALFLSDVDPLAREKLRTIVTLETYFSDQDAIGPETHVACISAERDP